MSDKKEININEMTFNEIMQKSVVTDEFYEAYRRIVDKYWVLPKDADDYQKNAQLLHTLSHSSHENLVIASGLVIQNMFQVLEQNKGTITGSFGIGDKDIYFRLSDSPNGMDKMHKLINNAVMVKHKENQQEDS